MSDLALATRIAVHAASALGLDVAAGLVWSGKPDLCAIPETLAVDAELRSSVRAMLAEAYADALALVRRRVDALEAAAAELVARRTLGGDDVFGIASLHPAGFARSEFVSRRPQSTGSGRAVNNQRPRHRDGCQS